ncbi:MAG TPA: nucleotidyltransferase domain-containing protein [Prolixibacteraceae bacterium]|nr:nucleotidyltransferase domain-containing protein [Prolixibacteraceae bacterium]
MKTRNTVVLSRIKNLVREIDPTSDVILYGSRARGEEHPESDWDLLILVNTQTDLDYERVFRHRLYEIELELGEAFSVSVYNKKEWKLNHWMTPLYQNIAKEGLRI